MKNLSLLLLALLVSFATTAQDKHTYLAGPDIMELFWSKKIVDKEVPADWKKSDAIVLHKEIGYELLEPRAFKFMAEVFQYHYRIQVLNADGIREFSEIEIDIPSLHASPYLNAPENEVFVAARVVKAKSGRIVEVGAEHIVHLEAKASTDKKEKLKIAVPQLEAGDILDYFVYMKLPEMIRYQSYSTGAVEFYLHNKYPVLHQQINVHLQKNSHLNYLSHNGAPEFKQVSVDKDETLYTLIDTNREANKEERWRLDTKDLPHVMFKVRYLSRKMQRQDKGYFELAQKKTGKELDALFLEYMNSNRLTVERTNAGKILARTVRILSLQQTFGRIEHEEVADIKKWIRQSEKKFTDPVDIAVNAYEAYRLEETGHRYEYDHLFQENASFDGGFTDMYTVLTFSRALKLKGIAHELVLTYSKAKTQSISERPNLQEMKLFVKVSNGKKSVYLSGFSALTVAGEFHPQFEGAEARVIKVPKHGRKVHLIGAGRMPADEGTTHYMNTSVAVAFDEENENLTLSRTIEAAGDLKSYLQQNMVFGYNYLDHAGLEELGVKTYKIYSREQRRNLEQTKQQVRERDQKRLNEWYELQLKDEFATDQLKLQEFSVQQPGMLSNAPALIFKDRFVVEGFASSAGTGYLLEVGKLIGEQVKLSEEEITTPRKAAIYFENGRTYYDEIKLTVPAGYVLSGLTNLNMNVDNAAGQFQVKAEQTSATEIKIAVKKVYKKDVLPKEAWADVVAFTEAANKFYKQQLLLKKGVVGRR